MPQPKLPLGCRIKEAVSKTYTAAAQTLDAFVNDLFAEHNFKTYLRYKEVSQPSTRYLPASADTWQGYPCYKIYFSCSTQGLIQKLGFWYEFSEQEMKQYYFGRFKIAVDQAQVQAAREAGIKSTDFPHEKIIYVQFVGKEIPKKVLERVKGAAMFYNAEFSFNPDYDGFTVGNLFDEDQ